MKAFTLLSALLLGLGAAVAPASAWPVIDVTASEVLSVDPPRVRTTFELSFAGYHPMFDGGYFEITPLEPASLHLFECAGPTGWVCGSDAPWDPAFMYFSSYHGTGAPYAPVNTFSIVTDQADPCVRIQFYDPVLAKAPSSTLQADHAVEMCLLVDAPVPARAASWGAVKSIYR